MIVKKIAAENFSANVEEEFSIPLCIDDIISICKEYNNLGSNIQNYMDMMFDIGVEQSIKSGRLNKQYLPHIKNFLKAIESNPYFGDAQNLAGDAIKLIEDYENANKKSNVINLFVN